MPERNFERQTRQQVLQGIIMALLLGLTLALPMAPASAGPAQIRQPVWAGSFYPSEPNALVETIAALTARAGPPAQPLPRGKVLRALILPHAGYVYSGRTAAYASLVLGDQRFDKVVLLGPDHRVGFRNGAVSDASLFRTPLGEIPLHADAGWLRRTSPLFRTIPASDRSEHSLEVILPFLQYYLKDFSLVPVVLGPGPVPPMSEAINELLGPATLLVVSSDLSHFLPYEEARMKDRATIDAILALDADALIPDTNMACGIIPIQVLINLARRNDWQPLLLHYANSGDTAGHPERVVGYAAIAFFGDLPMVQHEHLSHDQGQTLLDLARKTIADQLDIEMSGDRYRNLEKLLKDKTLHENRGTFVTLKKHGQLRGCIGTIAPVESIASGIRRNAVNAAFNDPRFPPLKKEEFNDLTVEVSILTDPRPLAYRDGVDLIGKLRPEVDGVILRDGLASATFLPQVWEQLPDAEDFLCRLCLKAGLSSDAWRIRQPEILTYQVQYFEEE